MRKLFYYLMLWICWRLEDVYDLFSDDARFYPSLKWEVLIEKVNYEN